MEKIDFNTLEVYPEQEFWSKYAAIDDISKVLIITSPGESLKQIIPCIYLNDSESYHFKNFPFATSSFLTFISTVDSVILTFQFVLDTVFMKGFDKSEISFAPIFKIDRKSILSFKHVGEKEFHQVKPSKSLDIMTNMRGAVPGGLVSGAIFRGLFRMASNLEKETLISNGQCYELIFNHNGTDKKISLIAENWYIDGIDGIESVLSNHWVSEIPQSQIEEIQNKYKEGCFIATACYGDYNHPKVITLRQFRDNVLSNTIYGRRLISFYYKYSPKLAERIKHKKGLKAIIRALIISPIAIITSMIKK